MIDRLAVHRLIHASHVQQVNDERLISQMIRWWQQWLHEPETVYHHARMPLPSYDNNFSPQQLIPSYQEPGTIVGIDGSQIYPDRHEGTLLGLLQVAGIAISYQQPASMMRVQSEITLIDGAQRSFATGTGVDAARYMAELAWGRLQAQQYPESVVLLDGSLIAWQLQELGIERQQEEMHAIVAQMEQYRHHHIMHAAYISLPNTKELLTLVRAVGQLSGEQVPELPFADADFLQRVLTPHQLTPWFASRAAITQWYPDYIRPWFCYVHTGTEIGRIELPQWLIMDIPARQLVLAAIMQQLNYGLGFPVVLSQAHAATVITAADRAYFYQAIARTHGIVGSTKSRLKQRIPY